MKWFIAFCVGFLACASATAQVNYPLAGQMGGGGSAPYALAGGMGAATPTPPVIQPLRSAVSKAAVGQGFVSGLAGTAVQGQSRMHMMLGDGSLTELHVCYGNWASPSEAPGPGNLIIEAALESDGPLGVAHFTWSGANTITLTPGQTACSDALLPSAFGLTVFPANSAEWFRTGATAVSNVGFPFSNLLGFVGEGAWAGPVFTSQVLATGPMTTPSGGAAASGMLTPFAVTGRYTVAMPSLCDIGDSISNGVNDSAQTVPQGYYTGNGYVGRAAALQGGAEIYPTFKLGIQGEGVTGTNYTGRALFFPLCTHGVVAWGTNDLAGGTAAATVLTSLEAVWNKMSAAGIGNIWQALVIPRTTSTDGWATEINQTPITNFGSGGARDTLNTSITAAIGTNHLTGTLDFSTVTQGVNHSLWITNNTVYTPNVTVTATTNAFSFSTGTFASTDVGKSITIGGAGTSGAALTTTISTVVSTTSITTAANAATTLVAAAEPVEYGTATFATTDGIHPIGPIHQNMAPFLEAAVASVGQQLPAFDTSWVPTGADWALNLKTSQAFGINGLIFGLVPTTGANTGQTRTSVGYGVTANNSTGVPIEFGPNTARVTTGRGWLIEKTTTNLFANPFTPATQTATVVNATQYTVSVTGTGSLALSGACTGTVTAGSPVTCTSASTSLTATVSGTLLSEQVETGAVATSPISGTRSAEEAGFPNSGTVPAINNVFASTAGTVVLTIEKTPPNIAPILAAFGADYLDQGTTTSVFNNRTVTLTATCGPGANGHTISGIAWNVGTGRGLDCNGGTIASDANATGALGGQVYVGGQGSGGGDSSLNSYVQMIAHYPIMLTATSTPTFQQATGSFSSTQAPGPSAVLYAGPYYSCTKNYYVATTGSDSNSTTQAQNPSTPWATIGRYNALAASTGGDCINVAAGTYATGVSITKGGTTALSTGYVVYRCQTLDGCTVTDTGGQTNNSAFSVQANYVMIDGFTINGGAGTGSFTVGIKTCGNNNCSGGTASTFSNHHIWVINNVISGYGQAGTELDNGEYFYTVHNTIFNNAHDCNLGAQGSNISYYLPFAIQGVYTPTADDASNPITGNTGTHFRQFIMWNKIYNAYVCSGSTVGVTDGNGIITDDWHGDQVSSCTFTTCIYTNGGLVAGNVTYNNGGGGIHIFNSEYVTVANNSVFNNYIQPGNTNQGYRGGIDDELSYGTSLINNLSYSGCGAGAEANNTSMGVFATDGYNGSTTLAVAVTSTSQSTITITSAAQFPGGSTFNSNSTLNMLFSGDYSLPGGNLIKIDNEIMWVTAGWNTTTWTVTRGYNGTTAATHSNSAAVTWIQSYWSNNITYATSPCTDLAVTGHSPNGVFYSSTANTETTLPKWTNVGNTSFGSQSTPPNGVNFALASGSPAISYGTISSPFSFLPSSAIDAGSCSSSLATCP
jgi:parallel beta-helix repeat protein